MDHAAELASPDNHRVYLIAPAGYGKTHTIADAISRATDGRHLILTHTHAGVHAIRAHLRRKSLPSQAYHVETIAGWALRYARAYPAMSGLSHSVPSDVQQWMPETDGDWSLLYPCVVSLTKRTVVQDILRVSYASLYVDEYQDCTLSQHAMIMSLADILPCRILGDPLQGIYGFGDDNLVDMSCLDGLGFRRLRDLDTPHRWCSRPDGNTQLGHQLHEIRLSIEQSGTVDLVACRPAIRWEKLDYQNYQKNGHSDCVKKCYEADDLRGTIAVIFGGSPRVKEISHKFAKGLGGLYRSVEEISSSALMTACRNVAGRTGIKRVRTLRELAQKCMTSTPDHLKAICAYVEGTKTRSKLKNDYADLTAALECVRDTNDLGTIIGALEAIRSTFVKSGRNGCAIHRPEVWYGLIRAIEACEAGRFENLEEAAWHGRQVTSIVGRKMPARCVSRTLLIKGLEVDHAIVIVDEEMDARNLYVALTRGSQSLTVLSPQPVIPFTTPEKTSVQDQSHPDSPSQPPEQGSLF